MDGGINEKILSKILYTLLLLTIQFVGVGILTDFNDFGVILFFLLSLINIPLIFFKWKADQNKKCTWCSKKTGLKFIDGRLNNSGFSRHMNKDGSSDKRFTTNFQFGFFYSKYYCNKCNAETEFMHGPGVYEIMSKNGNYERFSKISKRTLVKNGNGNREGTDWEKEKKPDLAQRVTDFLIGKKKN